MKGLYVSCLDLWAQARTRAASSPLIRQRSVTITISCSSLSFSSYGFIPSHAWHFTGTDKKCDGRTNGSWCRVNSAKCSTVFLFLLLSCFQWCFVLCYSSTVLHELLSVRQSQKNVAKTRHALALYSWNAKIVTVPPHPAVELSLKNKTNMNVL